MEHLFELDDVFEENDACTSGSCFLQCSGGCGGACTGCGGGCGGVCKDNCVGFGSAMF